MVSSIWERIDGAGDQTLCLAMIHIGNMVTTSSSFDIVGNRGVASVETGDARGGGKSRPPKASSGYSAVNRWAKALSIPAS